MKINLEEIKKGVVSALNNDGCVEIKKAYFLVFEEGGSVNDYPKEDVVLTKSEGQESGIKVGKGAKIKVEEVESHIILSVGEKFKVLVNKKESYIRTRC